MILLDTIKRDQLAARKAKDQIEATLLTTLLSEATMVGKNSSRESTDAEVVQVVKKFIKNAEELLLAALID